MTEAVESAPRIEIGYIAGAHGIYGELRLKLHNPDPSSLVRMTDFEVRSRDGKSHLYTLESIRATPKFILVGLKEVTRREEAEALKGSTVWVQGELEEDEVYLEHLRHFTVIDEVHGELGKIVGFMSTNLEILVIRGDAGQEFLVPLLPGTLLDTDAKTKCVTIQTPEGLLEV